MLVVVGDVVVIVIVVAWFLQLKMQIKHLGQWRRSPEKEIGDTNKSVIEMWKELNGGTKGELTRALNINTIYITIN